MNVFVIGWNLSSACQAEALARLRNMVNTYPLLDGQTLRSIGEGSQAFAASIQIAPDWAGPSSYVYRSDDSMTMFDGCPIEGGGRFNSLDARDLCAFWTVLPGALDGQFIAARIDADPPRIEIVNDRLGVYQVYYVQQDSMWMVSNSVYLLDRLSGGRGLDPLGVSLFMTKGFAGGNRTFKEGIRLIDPAQHWTWSNGNSQPYRSTYFERSSLAHRKQVNMSSAATGSLAGAMVHNLRIAGARFGRINCPVTAGRDTRLLVGLTLRSGVEAKYFTNGNPDSPDARIGSIIARELGLSHTVRRPPDGEDSIKDVIANWDALSEAYVRRTDGMVSVRCAAEASPVPRGREESTGLFLFGMGGEIARGYLTSPAYYTQRHTKNSIHKHLLSTLRKNYIRPAALNLVQDYLRRFIDDAIAEGFRLIDIPDLSFAYDNVRRWAAANYMHLILRGQAVYAPFCDAIFVDAAFSTPVIRRYSENLHYDLIKQLAPELHALPYEKPWLSRSVVRNRATFWMGRIFGGRARRGRRAVSGATIDRTRDRSMVLEANRLTMRSLCLDQTMSPLWDLIDRGRFERVMSDTASAELRERDHRNIYAIVTLFQYAALQD
jgi:asparagine synthase (glutamine-hydrolysing)